MVKANSAKVRVFTFVLLGTLLIGPSGCHVDDSASSEVHVLVATSVADEVRILVNEFQQHTGHRVVVVSGASNSLARQIISGAPADVFVSAHRQWHQSLVESGMQSSRSEGIAGNRLCLVTLPGNPLGIEAVSDLLEPAVEKIAIGGTNVPVGDYARQYLESAGLLESVGESPKVILAPSAATVAMWLDRGEVDAAFVYASDVTSEAHVITEVPDSLHDEIVYRASVIFQDQPHDHADAFVDFLSGDRAQELFRSSGFRIDSPVAGSSVGN